MCADMPRIADFEELNWNINSFGFFVWLIWNDILVFFWMKILFQWHWDKIDFRYVLIKIFIWYDSSCELCEWGNFDTQCVLLAPRVEFIFLVPCFWWLSSFDKVSFLILAPSLHLNGAKFNQKEFLNFQRLLRIKMARFQFERIFQFSAPTMAGFQTISSV